MTLNLILVVFWFVFRATTCYHMLWYRWNKIYHNDFIRKKCFKMWLWSLIPHRYYDVGLIRSVTLHAFWLIARAGTSRIKLYYSSACGCSVTESLKYGAIYPETTNKTKLTSAVSLHQRESITVWPACLSASSVAATATAEGERTHGQTDRAFYYRAAACDT